MIIDSIDYQLHLYLEMISVSDARSQDTGLIIVPFQGTDLVITATDAVVLDIGQRAVIEVIELQ
jgi:hypothetical protein